MSTVKIFIDPNDKSRVVVQTEKIEVVYHEYEEEKAEKKKKELEDANLNPEDFQDAYLLLIEASKQNPNEAAH